MVAGRKQSRLQPCLILIMGVAGSGKTTLAQGIVRHVSAVYLDNNYLADAFFPHARNGAAYERLRPGFYKALYRITEENLKLGNSVLLDVPHIKEIQTAKWRTFIKGMVKRIGATMVVIKCFCSEEALRARLRSRGKRRDGWKLTNWNDFLREQPINAPIPFPHLEIDTEKSLSSNIGAAVRYVRKRQRAER